MNEAKRSVLRQNSTNEAKRSVLRQNATNKEKLSVLRQNATNEAKRSVLSVKTANTPIETQKPLVKDEEASDVDVHLYRSMIGSLMYVTASRPDIMFAVCACSRFQVTPKTSHLSAVKRIFRYLKGKPKLGLWYPRVSSFDLESYSDSDYAGANLDRKSTTGGCQFLGRRLITWQCKKQTIVATSTTEAEYVAAASCCGQVLWIQNQMLDNHHPLLLPLVMSQISHCLTHLLLNLVLDQAKEIKLLKAKIHKLKKQTQPVIKHHRSWIKSVSLKQRLPRKRFSKKQKAHKEHVSKQGRKYAKGESFVQGNPLFDELHEDSVEHMETNDAQDEGRTKEMVDEEKEIKKGYAYKNKVLKAISKSSQTPAAEIFKDDETIAKVLLNMSQAKAVSREKEKGVELREVEDAERPRPTSQRSLLTLKPLPKIDPKDKGKKKIVEEDESESEDDDIPQAVKKIQQALRVLKNGLGIFKNNGKQKQVLRQTEFLLRSFRARKRAVSQLKKEQIEEYELKTTAMYEKIKRSDEDFIAIGSVEDDRLIKRMNKKDSSKGEEIKQESKEEVKEEDKGEENTRKRKHGTRKKMKSRKRRFKQDTSQDDPSDIEKENDELRLCLTIAPDEDKEVDYEILDKKYPIIDWKTEYLGTKPQFDKTKRSEEINMNVVTRSNGQKRCFSTLMRVLSVFDREDLDAVYKLVMDIYQDKIPEGFDKVLWGDLIVMFNPDEQDEFWNSQHEWKVVSWKLHSSSGVHTLMTDEGLVVHMLIEKKYPLKKEILMQMLKLKLESEEESTMALELIRFIKKGSQLPCFLGEDGWLVQDPTVLGKHDVAELAEKDVAKWLIRQVVLKEGLECTCLKKIDKDCWDTSSVR
ncbi:hypothetical protein Tco_0662475 [Tanacetum coccineum]